MYERDHVLVSTGGGLTGIGEDDIATIGHNFEAVIADLETRMREAAADLDFEEAARLRDEVKRLRATELAVMDDPTAKYPSAAKFTQDKARNAAASASKVHKPELDEMGIALHHEVAPRRPGGTNAKRDAKREGGPRKPTLDEMGPGPSSSPTGRGRARPQGAPACAAAGSRGDADAKAAAEISTAAIQRGQLTLHYAGAIALPWRLRWTERYPRFIAIGESEESEDYAATRFLCGNSALS